MVLPALVGGLASSAGGSIFSRLFGDSAPSPGEILRAQSKVLNKVSDETLAKLESQTRELENESQAFLNNYVSDDSRNNFRSDARSFSRSLLDSAAQGGISFGDAGSRFMNSALTAGIKPGDKLNDGNTLSDYSRMFDQASRDWAPTEFGRGINTDARLLLGRDLTKNEKDNVYKFGTMTNSQARELMNKSYEGMSRNFQNTADAASGWYYGGRAVYPNAESRFNPEENARQQRQLGTIA
jgi:hypothetical protein